MTTNSEKLWQAYYLCHKDHKNLSYEAAAEEMGVPVFEVARILKTMQRAEPALFTDISSGNRRFDHRVSRYESWCEDQVVRKF